MTNGFTIGGSANGDNLAQADFDIVRFWDGPTYAWRIGAVYTNMLIKWFGMEFETNQSMNISESEFLLGTEGASYPSNALWIEPLLLGTNQFNQDTNALTVILHGTLPEDLYQIESKVALTDAVWIAEQQVLGALDQDWTLVIVPMNGRPSLFLKATALSLDSDSNELPDDWEMRNFGHTGVDPYADPDGDGWLNIQEFNNGTDPNGFNTPPPPKSITGTLDATGTNLVLNWESGGGPVDHYALIGDDISGEINIGNTLTYTYAPTYPNYGQIHAYQWGDIMWEPSYAIRAYFTNGSHVDSPGVAASTPGLTLDGQIIRGPNCLPYLAVVSPPADLSAIRLFWVVYNHSTLQWEYFWSDISPNFINGFMLLPTNVWPSQIDDFTYLNVFLQAFLTNGSFGPLQWTPFQHREQYQSFVDARPHMKENLKFLLRSATATQPFGYGSDLLYTGKEPYFYFGRPSSPTDYEYYGIYYFNASNYCSFLYEKRPVQENFLWRNFLFDMTDVTTNGDFVTGASWRTLTSPKYQYTGSFTENPLPVIHPGDYRWWYYRPVNTFPYPDPDALAEVALYEDADTNLVMSAGVTNVYGLPFASVHFRWGTSGDTFSTLEAGNYYPRWQRFYWGYGKVFFVETPDPQLQTVGYYFASQTPFFNYVHSPPPADLVPPLPGSPTFSLTNSSPVLITGIGQQFVVSGWARQAILNGDPNKFAFLGQYFDKAYKANPDLSRSTNETGLLSEYGEFFPTEPGPQILTTKPDPDQGNAQGECLVHVLKMQVDVNHDGIMDLSLAGPDNTSPTHPFRFWINNDFDRWHYVDCVPFAGCDEEQDDLPRASCGADTTRTYTDAEYLGYVPGHAFPAIPCNRDLEDYARLWLPGLTSLMGVMPTSYRVRLTLIGDGAIRLFRAVETDGSTNYLFNDVIASNQVNNSASLYVGLLTSSSPIILTNEGEHFIWCGAKRGPAEVHLQILDGTNMLADTASYIDLKDIKEMYERWSVGDKGSKPPTNTAYRAEEDLPAGVTAFQYGPPESTDTPYILFVHGWNAERWEKDRLFAESALQRLYWQGYKGRFGSFRWPTLAKFPAISGEGADLNHYDKSELNAWQSGAALRKLLVSLDSKYPGQVRLFAHSMGNVVAGEALNTNMPLVAVYIAMQAAVPSGAYWLGAPFRVIPPLYFDGTTELYRFYPVFIPSRPYFNFSAGAAVYVNFFNPLDWALNWWLSDQNLKPADSLNYSFDISTNTFFQFQGTPSQRILTTPTNTFELFAFCVEGQCWALGAQTNVAGVFSTVSEVNLNTLYSFGNAHKGHSAQFRSTNMRRAPFWDETLKTFLLKPRP